MDLPQYITINGTAYASANLSEVAKAQASNIQVVDAELARLQQQIAIAQTARNAYAAALMAAVKDKTAAKTEKVAKAAKAEKSGTVVKAETAEQAEAPAKPRAARRPKAKAEAA